MPRFALRRPTGPSGKILGIGLVGLAQSALVAGAAPVAAVRLGTSEWYALRDHITTVRAGSTIRGVSDALAIRG